MRRKGREQIGKRHLSTTSSLVLLQTIVEVFSLKEAETSVWGGQISFGSEQKVRSKGGEER